MKVTWYERVEHTVAGRRQPAVDASTGLPVYRIPSAGDRIQSPESVIAVNHMVHRCRLEMAGYRGRCCSVIQGDGLLAADTSVQHHPENNEFLVSGVTNVPQV